MSKNVDVVRVGDGRVAIKLHTDDGQPVNLVFEREKLLEFIQLLGSAHAQLLGQEKTPPIEEANIMTTRDTNWVCTPVIQGAIFAHWNRLFGPLGVILPDADVESLHALLGKQIAARAGQSPRQGH